MDANGLRFWSLADAADWRRLGDPPQTHYDRDRRTLRLASARADATWPDHLGEAVSRLERVPQTIDQYGTRAYWDPSARQVRAIGAVSTPIGIFAPSSATQTVTDLALGHDGILYVALSGTIVMLDRRDRWPPQVLRHPSFKAWRVAADPSGGVWALDKEHRKLARVRGAPIRTAPADAYLPDVVRPCNENPDPPRLLLYDEATWPAADQPVALACSLEGRVALLTWRPHPDEAEVRVLTEHGTFGSPVGLKGAVHPYSLAWLSAGRLAVLLPGTPGTPVAESPMYALEPDATVAHPSGDYYPLRDHDGGPFVHGLTEPPRYGAGTGTVPLVRLSLPSFLPAGDAHAAEPFDSRHAQTVWHRLYLEAVVPQGCGIRVFLAATDELMAPLRTSDEWHEHCVGDVPNGKRGEAPQAAWMCVPSELPFHNGMLPCDYVKERSGLFTALIQRSDRRVRTVKGRYLWVRVELSGNGRATPEVAALRAYGSRFSYLNRYLPSLYREQFFGRDADARGPSTPADFLERFLDNFEGILTPLEDRVASAHLLTDPACAPDAALEWLASWVGLTFDPAYPLERRRALLQATPELYRSRGTLRGLSLALEIATDGGVTGGEVVILEDFRLRRTLATILGADLADEADPLLAGRVSSGNSFVGDTLFLGDEHRKEFLAMYSADLPTSAGEDAAIARFYDDLAHRVTVLVHEEVEPQDLGLIRRVMDAEIPAHVLGRVIPARYSLLVGLASLVGVDTYLASRPGRQPVKLGRSRLGVKDFVQRPPSLDPRLEGGRAQLAMAGAPPPVAAFDAPDKVAFGESFTLDASRSRAAAPNVIVRHDWKMTQ